MSLNNYLLDQVPENEYSILRRFHEDENGSGELKSAGLVSGLGALGMTYAATKSYSMDAWVIAGILGFLSVGFLTLGFVTGDED